MTANIKDLLFFARIKEIEFVNFRNIEKGTITMPNSKTSDFIEENPSVLGLYGQNGSGKTSVVMALGILKDVLSGRALSNKYMSSIRYGCDHCSLKFVFTLYTKIINEEGEAVISKEKSTCYDVYYSFDIAKRIEEDSDDELDEKPKEVLYIKNEVLKYRMTDHKGNLIVRKQTFISTKEKNARIPYTLFGSENKAAVYSKQDLNVFQKYGEYRAIAEAKSQSFIFLKQTIDLLESSVIDLFDLGTAEVQQFGNDFLDMLISSPLHDIDTILDRKIEENFDAAEKFILGDLYMIPVLLVKNLRLFGTTYLHVVDTTTTGITNINSRLPLLLWAKIPNQGILNYRFSLQMSETSRVPEKSFNAVKACLDSVSDVLETIVPGVRLNFEDYGIQLSSEGDQEHYFEITSQRGETVIPLKYESDGIRRIVSILSLLIAVYNDPSFTVAIDEIDSGIFEYLLGEILAIMSDSVKGQLIFTSHNLRPLEVLPSKFLCFTTTDPEKRFTSIAARGNSNLRDTYFRSIVLNTHKDSVYNPTDRYEIELALYKAGHLEEKVNE